MFSIRPQLIFTFTLLLLHFGNFLFGKPPLTKDKLWRDYKNAELPDSTRINALISLSNQYLNYAPDSALLLARQSRQEAELSHFSKGEIIALTHMAKAHWSLGQYENALGEAQQAISIAHQAELLAYIAPAYGIIGVVHEMRAAYDSALHYAQIARAIAREYAPSTEGKYLLNIALIYELTGAYQKAFETYELSLDKYKSAKDTIGIGKVYNNLGVMYDLQGNYAKALTYYNKALQMRESTGHTTLIATSLNNLGAIYLYQHDYKKALHYLQKALELRIEVNDKSNIAGSYNNLGEVYLIQGELEKSKASYQKAINLNKKIGHKRVEISSLGGMAKVYTQQKDLSQAMEYAQQALSLSRKLGIFKDICQNQLLVGELLYRQDRLQEAQIAGRALVSLSSEKGMLEELKEGYHLLQLCFSKTQQVDSAFHYLQSYYALKDSLWTLEKNETAERIKNNLELNFKEKELKILQEKEALLAGKNQQQNHKIIILGAAALLLSLSTLGLFILYIKNQRFRHTIQKSLEKIQNQSVNLLSLNKDLESANEILEIRNQELYTSNKLLQQFAYTASHDLRGPIINLRQLSQIILEDQDNLHPLHQQHLGFMVQSADRSLSLIDDLLAYAAVGKKLPEPEIVDLLDVLQHTELSLQYQIKESRATFEYKNIIPVKAHSSLCGQLFQNLISNALKFRQPEITPHLLIGFDTASQAFYVQDNGIGIDSSQHNKLFNLFDRAGQNRSIEGSGIGLATCKRIVEFYQGKIWYESQKGSGSTFFFTLPQAMLD